MKLYHLLEKYNVDDLMPVINEMFPGTKKYRPQLEEAYDLLMKLKPQPSKKAIRYKIIEMPDSPHSYMGAEDKDFNTTWEVCLGKEVEKGPGVDLQEIDIVANCLVNLCFLGKCPKAFEPHREVLKKA